jgi:hypothetical protein
VVSRALVESFGAFVLNVPGMESGVIVYYVNIPLVSIINVIASVCVHPNFRKTEHLQLSVSSAMQTCMLDF